MSRKATAQEPHVWEINITCPRCKYVGNLTESFPCCECCAKLVEEVVRLRSQAVRIKLIAERIGHQRADDAGRMAREILAAFEGTPP